MDGSTYLFGVNIFDCEWVDTNKRIRVSDLSYDISVYVVIIDNVQYEFAAGERINCIWNFYVYTY